MAGMFRCIDVSMKGGEVCVVEPFISLFATFNLLSVFLWERSLSFVEDAAFIYDSSETLSLLVRATQENSGKKHTRANKHTPRHTHARTKTFDIQSRNVGQIHLHKLIILF